MNVWNIARQQWVITFPSNWKRRPLWRFSTPSASITALKRRVNETQPVSRRAKGGPDGALSASNLTPIKTVQLRAAAAQVIQSIRQVRQKRTLIEVLVRIAHVRIFRFVTDLRGKFRIAGMNVRNVGRQNRVIAFPPNWKRKCQNLDQTSHVSCG